MLVNASGDVGGDAGIKRAARCICHDVDVTPLHRRQLAPAQTWMPACAGMTDSTNRPATPLAPPLRARYDRQRVVSGKSVSVRVARGGRRIIKKQKQATNSAHP